jgi:cell shape-determining protein MreC
VYPKGINIGRIRDITAPAYETSLVLQVQPIIDFDRLEYIVLMGPEIESAAAPVPASPPAPAVKP